jgi:cold shock CspA family protein
MTGTIKRLMVDPETGRSRGYGFIKAQGIEYFFHHTGLQQTTKAWHELREGDRVEFTVIPGEKGPRAIEVRVL